MTSLARKQRRIKAKFEKKGKPVPVLDLSIAGKKSYKFLTGVEGFQQTINPGESVIKGE